MTDPADFVGQAACVRRVYSRIGADRPQSVAIIGGRKSGKTSLLEYLSHPSVAARHLEEPASYLFLTFIGDHGISEDSESFLRCLAQSLPGARAASSSNLYEGIQKEIEALHAALTRVIVFLDDFDRITSNDRFPLEFFSFLRSMANNYNLAYVTTSFMELQKLCSAKEIQESPFFNIFTNMHLGMLSREDAKTLILRRAGIEEAQAERAIAWCGGSPYLLEKAGAWLARGGAGYAATETEFGEALLAEMGPFFEELVSALPPEALKPLQGIPRGRAPQPSDEHHLSPLVKQGFIVDGEDGWSASSLSFDLFLRKALSARMLRGRT
jgi:hypothetical protein